MENYTTQSEVDALRRQLTEFKQRLDKQQIVSDRLLRRSMQSRIIPFARTSVVMDAIGLLLSPVIFVALHNAGVSWWFGAAILAALLIEFAYNVVSYRQLQRLFASAADLLTVRRGLLRFKRYERLWMVVGVSLIILWLAAFFWRLGVFSDHLTGSAAAGIITASVGTVAGLAFAFAYYAWEMRRVNQSVCEIDDLAAEE